VRIRRDPIRKIVKLAIASTAAVGMSALGFDAVAANAANGVQPVTFSVSAGSLTIAQTPSAAIALVAGVATAMPDTTVTDGRNDFGRTGIWTATNAVSDLTESGGGIITASNIAMAQTGGFTAGTGSGDDTVGGTVAVTGDTINSVYVYTPTADLTVPANPNSGSYTGAVTQTVV
jgi:hypothetical protein